MGGPPRLSEQDSGKGSLRPNGTRKFESIEAYRKRCAKNRQRCKVDPKKVKNWNLRRYGINVEKFDALLAEQKGKCLICGERPKKLFVDHCHTTKKVRGLLCPNCNTVLGMVKENTRVLKQMIVFLEWWNCVEPKDSILNK